MSDQEVKPPEAEQPPEAEAKKTVGPPVEVVEGTLTPANANQLVSILEKIAKGGGFPKRFDTVEKRIAAYNLAHSISGHRWQLALANIAEIHGTMSIWGELPCALAEMTKDVQERDTYVIDSQMRRICIENANLDMPAYAGVCDIQRNGRKMKQYTFTLEEARAAGLYPAKKRDGSPNPDSPWEKYTKIMLMRKARTLALKMEFPDALQAIPVAEYDFDELPDKLPIRDVTPGRSEKAENLNKDLAG